MKKEISPDCEVDIEFKETPLGGKAKVKFRGEGCSKIMSNVDMNKLQVDN